MAEVGAATDGLKWVGRATTEDMVAVIVERYIHVERSTSLWMDGTESWRHCSLVKGGANGAVGHVPRRAREPRQVVIVIVYTMLHGTALEGEAHWWEYIHPRVQATEIMDRQLTLGKIFTHYGSDMLIYLRHVFRSQAVWRRGGQGRLSHTHIRMWWVRASCMNVTGSILRGSRTLTRLYTVSFFFVLGTTRTRAGLTGRAGLLCGEINPPYVGFRTALCHYAK